MEEQLDLFGATMCEYLVIIEPDPVTTAKVVELKKLLQTFIFLPDRTLHAQPHLSIGYRQSKDDAEAEIIRKIKSAVAGLHSFEIEIDGAEIWKDNYSERLVLKIVPSEATQQLMSVVQQALGKSSSKTPHITIANHLSKGSLDSLSLDAFHYNHPFICNGITILKHSGKRFEVIEQIALSV
jgi:2'-5' RNA ligase